MNMKSKRMLTISALLFLLATILFTAHKNVNAEASIATEIYGTVSLEDKFADDRVVIVLNKEASLNFKTYTPEDFPEGLFRRVDDSTALTMELVRKQLKAEETEDWSELKLHIENAMLVDVENFRRILDLSLTNPSKENVIAAIKLLAARDDVIYAGPDFFFELQALPNPLPSNYYSDGVDYNGGYYYSQSSIHNLIKLPMAWSTATGSPAVLVGVLDRVCL